MAEALTEDESPLSEYLRHANLSASPPSTSSHPSPPSSTSSNVAASSPSPFIPPSTRPSPRLRTRSHTAEAVTERVKYVLATSALLSVKLSDAVQLYPPLEALERTGASGKGKGRADEPGPVGRDAEGGMASWPEDWEDRGQGWLDRGVVGNAEVALSGLVSALKRLSRSQAIPLPMKKSRRKVQETRGMSRGEEIVIEKVERFISAAQELDLRVAAALGAIKELECIAHGLGLSDPLPPISRIEARSYTALLSPSSPAPSPATSHAMLPTPSRSPRLPPRVPSPLIPSPPRPSPPPSTALPLRALALRQALFGVLSAALTAFTAASTQLNALLPPSSPLLSAAQQPSPSRVRSPPPPSSTAHHAPQASLSELLRHTRLAAQDREELESFRTGPGSAVSSSHSRNTSLAGIAPSDAPFDPFHPTETTFGGIDRRRTSFSASSSTSTSMSATASRSAFTNHLSSLPLKRQASLTLRGEPLHRHRVRPSLGAVGAFGLGTAGGGAAPSPVRGGGGRAKRPVSMGGGGLGSGLSSAFRLRSEVGNGSAPSSPSLSAKEVEELPDEEELDSSLLAGRSGKEQREGEGKGEGKGEGEDLLPFLLVSLQEAFEDAHDARKAVLWRVLAALEEPSEELAEGAEWDKVGEAVERLEGELRAAAGAVRKAVEAEFGMEGSEGRARAEGDRGEGFAGEGRGEGTIKTREREKRRRSGYYGRAELDDSPPPASSFANIIPPSSSPSPFATPSPASSSFPNSNDRDRLKPGVQSALARLSSGGGSGLSAAPTSPSPVRRYPRPSAPPPAAFANFAPSSSSSSHAIVAPASALSPTAAELQIHLSSLSLPLRALQAKLRLISSDLPSVLSQPQPPFSPSHPTPVSAETARLLATYDSLLPEIEALHSSFHNGRAALRVALGVDAPPRPLLSEKEEEAEGEEELPAVHSPLDDSHPSAPPSPSLGAAYASLPTSSCSPPTTLDEDFASRQALLDAALSLSLLPPPTSDHGHSDSQVERVFEAVAGPERAEGGAAGGAGKLSREERIRRMKEAREALAVGRTSLDGGSGGRGGLGGVGGGGGGGVEGQQKLVGELREVLRELNREKGRV